MEDFKKKDKTNADTNDCDTNDSKETQTPETASSAFDDILQRVGNFHRFQWQLAFITGFSALVTGIQNVSAVFIAASPDHRCTNFHMIENNLTLTKHYPNELVSWIPDEDEAKKPSKCNYPDYNYTSIYNLEYQSMNRINGTIPDDIFSYTSISSKQEKFCNSWQYDDSIFASTVVTEWDLVCEHRWLMSLTQSTFIMGTLAGAIIFSPASDKMGRRTVSLICACLSSVCSITTSFASSYILFLSLRFITAAAGVGLFYSTYILLMETVNMKGRNIMGNLSQLSFPISAILLSLCSYAFSNWRNLQLVISIPTLAYLAYFWYLLESPRWLLMHGREEEAILKLKSIAECNGKPFPAEQELKPLLRIISGEVEKQDVKFSTMKKLKSVCSDVAVLFKTRNMRRRNLIMFQAWFATLMGFFGLPFIGETLSASLHITVAATGVVGIIAGILLILILTRIGRRPFMCTCFFVSGIACISIIFVPLEMVWLDLILVAVGHASLSCTYSLVCMVSAELAPTPVRNISFGLASTWGRFGAVVTPFIVDLVGDISYTIPSTIFGIMSLVAGLLSLLLPETGNKQLPESVEEIEAMPR